MRIRQLLCAIVALFPLSASAAEHTWLGTESDKTSNAANWNGGSPAGDPAAVLIFPASASRTTVVNDIPNLTIRELRVEGTYTIGGTRISANDATITIASGLILGNDLTINGTLAIDGGWSILSGAIGGSGGLSLASEAMLSGSQSNSYAGATVIRGTRVRLTKDAGATAVANLLRIESGHVEVRTSEQIGNASRVELVSGSVLELGARETIGSLHLQGSSATTEGYLVLGGELTIGSGDSRLTGRVSLAQSVLEIPANGALVTDEMSVPAGGITLRGGGLVKWSSEDANAIRIDGVSAEVTAPESDVSMTGGSITGLVKSLSANRGIVRTIESAGDIRLASAVTVNVAPTRSDVAAPIRLNGVLTLADATLELDLRGSPGWERGWVSTNRMQTPVVGTFSGLPEGATIATVFRLSYRTGTSHDISVTKPGKVPVTVDVQQTPSPIIYGSLATFTVTLSSSATFIPTGTVTFRDLQSQPIETETLADGRVSVEMMVDDMLLNLRFDYSGDELHLPTNVSIQVKADVLRGSIESVTPSSAVMGSVVPLVVRGSSFTPEMAIHFGDRFLPTTFVSDRELTATVNLPVGPFAIVPVSVGTHLGRSASVPFQVLFPHDPVSDIQFLDNTTMDARVRPGASVMWLTSVATAANQFRTMTDDDGDGRIVWQWPDAIPLDGIFSFVDLRTGEVSIRARGRIDLDVASYPPFTFARNTAGQVASVMLRLRTIIGKYRLLWVRPGVGAWHLEFEDGFDDDLTLNLIAYLTPAKATSLTGAPTPAGFIDGDVVTVMNMAGARTVFTGRIGDSREEAAGMIVQPTPQRLVPEEGMTARLPVIRGNGWAGTATVDWRTADGTAIAGQHYGAGKGTLRFAPGESVKYIELPIVDNFIYDEGTGFQLILSNASGAELGTNPSVFVEIVDNEPRPVVTIVGASRRSLIERDEPLVLPIELRLRGATSRPVVMSWSRASSTQSGSVTFAPGEKQKRVEIPIEPGARNLRYRFVAQGVAVLDQTIDVTITDGNAPSAVPAVSVISTTMVEGDSQSMMIFDVELSAPHDVPLFVEWMTFDGSALAGFDYAAAGGELVFQPGQTRATVQVAILGDEALEDDETLYLALSPATWTKEGPVIDGGLAAGIIRNDDEDLPKRRATRR